MTQDRGKPPRPQGGANNERGPRAGERLLVVDDERIIRRLAARILGHLGYEVVEAPCGEAAIVALGLDARPILVAVVDYQMTGMNGIETIRALRGLQPGMTAIVATGHTELVEGIDEPGAITQILEKPYTATELGRAVERAISAAARPST